VSTILIVFGYIGGKYRERRLQEGRPLEEYEFYPFALDDQKILHFDLAKFSIGVRFLLSHRDTFAARQLILIGARKFKCTTMPIFRENFGLVGAICINLDVNYLQDEVRTSSDHLEAFIAALCKTDMTLDENILSKDEYAKALAGKRHYRDFAFATK